MARYLGFVVIASGFIALLLVALAGPSYRFNLLALGAAFSLLRWAALLGLASAITISGYGFWRRPGGRTRWLLVAAGLCGLGAFMVPLSHMQTARSVPAIHDISTDLENPPAFEAIVPLRQDSPNPPTYAGADTARQQREAYPHIQPLLLSAPLEQVYQHAQEVVQELGWQLVATEQQLEQARVEATDTTFWFGFKDDIVVRLHAEEQGTRVDVRSKSRVGKSDVGKNAERIENFLQTLTDRLGN